MSDNLTFWSDVPVPLFAIISIIDGLLTNNDSSSCSSKLDRLAVAP